MKMPTGGVVMWKAGSVVTFTRELNTFLERKHIVVVWKKKRKLGILGEHSERDSIGIMA